MTKLNITQEIFERHCSSATNADNAVFDAITTELEVAEQYVADYLGLANYCCIPDHIMFLVERAVCLYAYLIAIPHLDLVLTPTGFGVVSTSNVVPASADRVNRLQTAVKAAYEDCIDGILELLRYESSWNNSDTAVQLFSSFFWNGKQLRKCGHPNAHRSDLDGMFPVIGLSEASLRDCIGDEVVNELLAAIRTATATSKQQQLIRLIEHYISADIGEALYYETERLRGSIVRFLLNNIADFPTFENSSAYKAIKSETYENKKDDSCFFFG